VLNVADNAVVNTVEEVALRMSERSRRGSHDQEGKYGIGVWNKSATAELRPPFRFDLVWNVGSLGPLEPLESWRA